MTTWLALRLLLRRVPGVVWVIAFAVLLCALGAWGLYASGRRAGEVRVHRKALVDSIEKTVLVQHVAVEQTDRSRGAARTAERRSFDGRQKRNRLREAVVPLLDSLPDPVVRLIDADDQQIRRDSVTIAAYIAVDTTWARERLIAGDLDSLRVHQAVLGMGARHRGRTALYVAGGVVLGLVSALVITGAR